MGSIREAWSWAVNKCNEKNVGYSQAYRNQQTVDGITYYDCSSFINYALLAGGYKTPAYAPDNNAFTTTTMGSVLESLGFQRMSASSDWVAGDILWRKGHTEMVFSPTQSMGAHSARVPLDDQVSIVDSNPNAWTWLYREVSAMDDSFHCKSTGGFAKESEQAYDNAMNIYYTLSNLGWSVNAICGLLGNIGTESGYNPWRWQSDKVPSTQEWPTWELGYGFVQFTPPKKYIGNTTAMRYQGYGPNLSDSEGSYWDGYAQLQFVNDNVDGGYIKTSAYPYTYSEFKASTDDAATLARAWMHNYERPASYDTEDQRAADAAYWYDKLAGIQVGHSVTVDFLGGNGWIYDIYATPSRFVEEGTTVQLAYELDDPLIGLPAPEFIYWRVNYGDVEIIRGREFVMPNANVSITGMFTGKTIDHFNPIGYNRRRKLWLKPWYIQNRGE